MPTNSFGAFYLSHKNRLMAYLLKRTGDYHLAGDLTQESFTRYIEHYGRSVQSSSLLLTIARNLLLDTFRRQNKSVPLEEEPADPAGDQERYCSAREDCRRVIHAFSALDPSEKTVLSLAVGSRLTYREIGARTGLSVENVKVKVHRARIKLKKTLNRSSRGDR